MKRLLGNGKLNLFIKKGVRLFLVEHDIMKEKIRGEEYDGTRI